MRISDDDHPRIRAGRNGGRCNKQFFTVDIAVEIAARGLQTIDLRGQLGKQGVQITQQGTHVDLGGIVGVILAPVDDALDFLQRDIRAIHGIRYIGGRAHGMLDFVRTC